MNKKMKFDKEVMREVITNMCDSFDKQHLESPLFEHILENGQWLDNPDHIKTMIVHPFERCLKLAIESTQNTSQTVTSLWLNYDFLESNVSELCSQFYGMGCSVDRGNFIVKSYIKFKDTGVMPKLDWKQEYTFHYPKKGTLKQWFNFVEGADRLQHGYNKEYLIALQKLMKIHKESKNEKAK